MDAVNIFRGVFTLEDQHNDDKMILEVIKEDSMDVVGDLRCGYEGYSKEYRVMVCNESQFNDLVSQLETNFGESCTYSSYKDIYFSSKPTFNIIEPDKPVFTQAMADNGELPPVGSKAICEYCDGVELLIVAHDLLHEDGAFALVCDDSGYWGAEARRWKPIDQRTDKEKAIDGVRLSCDFNKLNTTEIALLSMAYDEWVGE